MSMPSRTDRGQITTRICRMSAAVKAVMLLPIQKTPTCFLCQARLARWIVSIVDASESKRCTVACAAEFGFSCRT